MSTKRPRGFKAYNPRPEAQALIDTARRVITEYSEILPITLRQLFYILVTRQVIGKTENDYGKLCELMNRARRAHMIDMGVFRDDGFRQDEPPGWFNEDQFVRTVLSWVDEFTLDRQLGQGSRLIVWCEAQGMVPQLERITHQYSIPVYSSGGFDSVTSRHDVAKSISDQGAAVEILHIGDHDPSGVHMFGSLDEDITAFITYYGGEVDFTRLAVTPAQIEHYSLPTVPPKPTDNRSFTGLTTQAEALDPRTLAGIVNDAIQSRTDHDILQSVVDQESGIRADLLRRYG